MNMKLLILSCSTGDGHNSAARALLEAAERWGIEAVLRDPVSFEGELAQKAVADLYNNMIRLTPKLFGAVYRAGDLLDRTGLKSPVYAANAVYRDDLADFLASEKIDAVISTHLYGMEAMTAVNHHAPAHIPSYGVLTDYTCIPFFGEPELDGCFLPHADLMDEAVSKGIPREKILPTGIPVSARFGGDIAREAARELIGIPESVKAYLLMSGGVGCGNMTRLCSAFMERIGVGECLLVLTGRNTAMKEELDKRYAGDDRMKTVSFTREVPAYMKAADVLVSKAGGLSSTEAAVAGVPLVHLMTIPGCETKNAEFFEAREMARRAKSEKDAVSLALDLAGDRIAAARMRENQKRNTHADASDKVIDYVLNNAVR